MKKKILLPLLSLLNCVCLILMCTTLTGCGEDSTLSEADSQLFQIACRKLKMTYNGSSLDHDFSGLVCEYDEEKYGTKVLATEIRAKGYGETYEGGNPLSFTVTFVTKSSTATNSKITVSTSMSFDVSNGSLSGQEVANYIFCTTSSKASKVTECQKYKYSKQAMNAEEFVNLMRTGMFNGEQLGSGAVTGAGEQFTIYNVGTSVENDKNGIRNLTILKVAANDSYHQEATTVSATQKQLCQTALGRLINTTTGTDANGQEANGYRAGAVNYLLKKMSGAAIAEDSNPVFAGNLVNDYFNGEPDYNVDENNRKTAGCQANVSLTLKNTYQYSATITFRISFHTEATTQYWTLTDESGETVDLTDTQIYTPGITPAN